MARARAYVGTSGWSYAHWRGDFYPDGLPASRWLSHLAASFPTVEVNNSFYRTPRTETVASWARTAPPGFLFSFKLWRGITHYARLSGRREWLERFLEAVRPCLPQQRAALLVHLPPQMKADPERIARLDGFLADLGHAMRRSPWRVAVEFRHPSWYVREIQRLLDRHDAALVLHDLAGSRNEEPNAASCVYVRRHGTAKYSGAYRPAQVRHDARRIADWVDAGRDVYAYYNNDIGGHAPRDARRLMELLGDAAAWPDFTHEAEAAAREPRAPRPGKRRKATRRDSALRPVVR